ncbi:gp53-like domain-containing protein [Arsenophonus sp. PmNCSU2021_1]|uniref:gp53-like domain-containing protein n=1 Tax=Arsenophonus sp. PmNCSU2021_1 TaxID=3118989 RepID=UPI002FF314C1
MEKENRWINKQIFNTLISGNLDGNAASATRLQTARKIAGVAFNGSADISIPAGNVGAYTKVEVDSRINAKGAKNTAHLVTNGWWKCGDTGLIRQWGITPPLYAGQIYTLTLPCPVPHAILSATATVKFKGIAAEGNLGTYVEIEGKSLIISADYTRTAIQAPRTWELVCY